MAPDTLEGAALDICPMNEAYSWKALPFNDIGGTTVSNIPESSTIRSLHSKKKTATPILRKIREYRKLLEDKRIRARKWLKCEGRIILPFLYVNMCFWFHIQEASTAQCVILHYG